MLVTETKNITVQQETADETGAVTMADVEIPQTTVSGVIAKDKDGKYHKFLGKKGVVLACGGYGGNHEMYVALQDEQRELYKSHGLDTSDLKCSGFGRDGSGIKMGMWAGASMDPCARTLVSPQVRYNSEHYATNILRWGGSFTEGEKPLGAVPFVWLDESGRRFTDETFLGVFGQLMRAERMKPGRYYAIFDSQYADLIFQDAAGTLWYAGWSFGQFRLRWCIQELAGSWCRRCRSAGGRDRLCMGCQHAGRAVPVHGPDRDPAGRFQGRD